MKKIGKSTRENRDVNIGLCICRHKIPEKESLDILKIKTDGNRQQDHMKKFLMQTSQHLEPPALENKRRKLQIEPHEMYIESTFSSTGKDIAALYFNFLPI